MTTESTAPYFVSRMSRLVAVFCMTMTLFILTQVVALQAQTVNATLKGSVSDPNGASLPGVTVRVLNPATGFQREVQTNSDGFFTFPTVPPATYSVTASKDGFATMVLNDIELNVNDTRNLPIQMKVGDVKEQVQIDASSEGISTSPAVATTIDKNLVERLPLNGRTIQNLIALTPGTHRHSEQRKRSGTNQRQRFADDDELSDSGRR